MNLVNIAKHLLYLTQSEFDFKYSTPSDDEIYASQQLFKILKSFKDSYFNELYTYESLDFNDEYDKTTDEEDTTDEEESSDEEENITDYDDNQYSNIRNHFTLEEMEKIVEWADQHPNCKLATIAHRFRKVKSMNYIPRFREYINKNGTRLEKLKNIKEFMWNEFYIKRTIEKEAIYDSDLKLFAIQKARELNWENFEADAHNWIESQSSLILKYSSRQILNSDHCSFQQEYVSPRTLSFTGERTTEVAVKKKKNITHSYPLQPITSADGQLLEKFFLILQEKENEFGKEYKKI
ncbi:unnamed protein product [Didymodactylos carnosus]|uniref:Uncharacterized protein n=1 Tax=Didymodactylos carnosus TaxID=1234261 RepID=A0A814P783_9BILA|nr:unnamed protein product [Didymodactylos carnosus]CAF3867219.1 unnamed protein product [Didymodactylos carnosus]